MILRKWFAALGVALAASLAAPANAQAPGSEAPSIVLEELAQTGAKSFDDFVGRAVLIEFFAYR